MSRGVFKTEAEREQYASDQQERHRVNTVACPHCGTLGGWTYGGLDPAWLGNGNAKLTEFSERLHWYGVPEFGHDHTPERCIAALVSLVAHATAFEFVGPGGRWWVRPLNEHGIWTIGLPGWVGGERFTLKGAIEEARRLSSDDPKREHE